MKAYDKFLTIIVIFIILLFAGTNLFFCKYDTNENGRPYRVEIERLAFEIETKGIETIDLDLSGCEYVVNIVCNANLDSRSLLSDTGDNPANNTGSSFYHTDSDYIIKEINGMLYRFDYISQEAGGKTHLLLTLNILLGILSILLLCVLFFIKFNILLPFVQLTHVPYELAKGNLTVPLPESKNRFFGKFVWGINLLRETIEAQKSHELALQKEKKTLLLSLSHDIKTPLSAVKLYAQALIRNLYQDKEKQTEIAENIRRKADEIENYVTQIITASKEDFLSYEVELSEFYLADLMRTVLDYYRDKLKLNRIGFTTADYTDCLLKGDFNRSVEVMQNLLENAIKYGDGRQIAITFSEEESCRLITIENSGCTLTDTELPHIFESFWRGANTENTPGSGLGLYICRQLMHKMNGDIYAKISGGSMYITLVFEIA